MLLFLLTWYDLSRPSLEVVDRFSARAPLFAEGAAFLATSRDGSPSFPPHVMNSSALITASLLVVATTCLALAKRSPEVVTTYLELAMRTPEVATTYIGLATRSPEVATT